MKLSLSRSITFWSGLLVMVFVCWAWRDSERQETAGRVGRFQLRSAWGGLVLDCAKSGSSGRGHDRFFRIPSGTYGGYYKHRPEAFPPPVFLRSGEVSREEFFELYNRVSSEGTQVIVGQYTAREYMKLGIFNHPSTRWIYFLPYWITLLAAAAVWLGLLVIRARRRSRTAIIP